MISPAELQALITQSLDDAQVDVVDRTGASDHYAIKVVSQHLQSLSLMDRHRKVMDILKPCMEDGRLHAVALTTGVPE